MNVVPASSNSPQAGAVSARAVLLLAAWFGLVVGLLEGSGLVVFQKLGWLNWQKGESGIWQSILWIAPLFDLIYFLPLGLLVLATVRFIPKERRLQGCVFFFSFVMFMNWTLLSGRIRTSASLVLAAGLATVTTRWINSREDWSLRFFRRSLPAVAALCVLIFVFVEGSSWLKERREIARLPEVPAGTPNVLVLVADTLRADHLSGYGYWRETSPNLDRLAQQGVLFERAFAASSWTLPSHASLLTGRFPHEHGATEGGPAGHMDGRFPTLAEALRDRGYRTAAFSANTYYFTRVQGFGRGFSHFEDFFATFGDMALRTVFGKEFESRILERLGYENIPARRLAGDINQALLRWLNRNPGRPFFAFLNYMDTHNPYVPPQPYRSRFSKLANPGGIIGWVERGRPTLTPEQLQGEIDAYDGSIAYLDDQISNLMTALRKRGLLENTIVVFTSDHGESFNEHGLYTHRNSLYRNVIHAPLVVCWPGKVPVGVRVKTPVSNMSLAVTLLELVGAGAQNPFPGPSLVPLWKNPGALQAQSPQLAELSQMPFAKLSYAPNYFGAMQSLVSSEWHYIHNEKLGTELFNWEGDPQELNNLAKTPEGQLVVSEMEKRLREAMSGSGSMVHLVTPKRVE